MITPFAGSLVGSEMDDCVRMDKTTEDDGYGGERTVWQDGAHFKAAIVFDSSTQTRIAQAQGVRVQCTVTTTKDVLLEFHDVFRRVEDGRIFRVVTDGRDRKTPETAGLNMRQVDAEDFTPANG